MIKARHALLLLVVVYWNAWGLLIDRISDGVAVIPVLILLTVFVIVWIKLTPEKQVPIFLICVCLIIYIAASIWGTALIKISAASIGILITCSYGLGAKKPPFAAIGIGILALPILPSLDFYIAWPVRQISAKLTAGLLKLNGFTVHVEGVAIAWQDQLLLFDGPCSGVRMLWASLLLTSILSFIGKIGPWRYILALIITTVLAIFANALRAASLFYIETGFVPIMEGPIFHEMVGVSSFIMLCALLVYGFHKQNERMSTCV